MITQADIARDLNLSLMTVYRCLNNKANVSPKTRERILSYIKKHNYRSCLIARALKTRKSNLIGLLVPSFSYSYYPEIIESIRETLANRYHLLLCLSGENVRIEREELEVLGAIPVDGILLSPAAASESRKNCGFLERQNIPYVLFDRFFPAGGQNISYVVTDCFEASRKLVHYLAGLGHRRIAHLGGIQNNSFSRQMYEGYRSGLSDCRLKFDSRLVCYSGLDAPAGRKGLARLLAEGGNFTALHCANDPAAIGALELCRKENIRVPDQLSITGFSDIDQARNLSVPLTTMREPTAEIGRIAAEALIRRIENPMAEPVRKQLPAAFIERGSCSAPRTTPKNLRKRS